MNGLEEMVKAWSGNMVLAMSLELFGAWLAHQSWGSEYLAHLAIVRQVFDDGYVRSTYRPCRAIEAARELAGVAGFGPFGSEMVMLFDQLTELLECGGY